MRHIKDYEMSAARKKTVVSFAREYPEWKREYRAVSDTKKAQRLDVIRAKRSGTGRPTENLAIRKAELKERIELVENTAFEADALIWKHLLRGVTEGRPFEKLRFDGMGCSRNTYYMRRQRFFYLLSEKMFRRGV